MAINSAIEWTDNSLPLVTGCSNKGVGCKNCYAVPLAWRLAHNPHPALSQRYDGTVEKRPDGTLVWTGRVNVNLDQLTAIQAARKPRTWFVSHVGDLFHAAVPPSVADALLTVAAMKPDQQIVILTKRTHRMAELLTVGPKPLANVWLGASIANDSDAAESAEPLASLAAAGWQTIASYEPAVGPVDWDRHGFTVLRGIISGGESGRNARPTHPDWHRNTRDFCLRHGIAFFFKQWGEWVPTSGEVTYGTRAPKEKRWVDPRGKDHWPGPDDNDCLMGLVGKKPAGRVLDGRTWNDLPWRVAA